MPDAFHTHIHGALANPGLQEALDKNAERRLDSRLQAYASLPEDILILRKRAHAVRAETIAHLESYLQQFIARAQANGLIVHRAANSAQAVEIVTGIARQHGARLIAKSKTMVGEEIRLNEALEEAGMTPVETDLGEYIVQLRHEQPGHIITPAVHLRRADVGKTFHEKLGIPYTDDIPTLTAVAQRKLRQTFLDADLGVSGVNFGVVESGSLCLLTNEGNGRMVTTIPPVHVALMGIERLVPTMDDLALMLSLLPRSSTGQKMTVYTSLIQSPRRSLEPDGPQERHLVLVDNGRSALVGSSLEEALYCIRCGACLNACPVFREIGGHAYVSIHGEGSPYSGPIGSVISPGLFGAAEFGALARASSLCGACKEACPVDIDLPELLLRVRAGAGQPLPDTSRPATPGHAPGSLKAGLRLYGWAAADARRFAMAQRMAGLFSRLFAPFSAWLRLPAWTGWGLSRDFPRPSVRPFHLRFQAMSQTPASPVVDRPAPQPSTPQAEISGKPAPLPRPSPAQLVSRFSAELSTLGGTVEVSSPAGLVRRLLAFLKERNITSISAWERRNLPDGLLEALVEAGIQVGHATDPTAQAGLTGAIAAVADTGTIVLASGPGRLQAASLLPRIHIAILYNRDIYENLSQVLTMREVKEASAVAFVSGPSRTADIEMSLTIGMHGPGEVHVFCLE